MADFKADAKPDWNNTENFDAEVVKEAVTEGDVEAPTVDVEADYAASKQLSEGIVDAELAAELIKPEFEVTSPEEVTIASTPNHEPLDYAELAKEVNPTPTAAENVTDELVEQAIAKGQPGHK